MQFLVDFCFPENELCNFRIFCFFQVQYELHSQDPAEKELNPQTAINVKLNTESLITNNKQNALLKPEMDKPKSILSKRNISPRGI